MSVPSDLLLSRMLNALASDTVSLAAGLQVSLVGIPFNATRSLLWDEVSADIISQNGVTPILCTAATRQRATDPENGDELVQINVPLGGFRWETTSAPSPAITAYGYVVATAIGNGETVYLSERFEDDVILDATAQVIEILAPSLRISQGDFAAP